MTDCEKFARENAGRMVEIFAGSAAGLGGRLVAFSGDAVVVERTGEVPIRPGDGWTVVADGARHGSAPRYTDVRVIDEPKPLTAAEFVAKYKGRRASGFHCQEGAGNGGAGLVYGQGAYDHVVLLLDDGRQLCCKMGDVRIEGDPAQAMVPNTGSLPKPAAPPVVSAAHHEHLRKKVARLEHLGNLYVSLTAQANFSYCATDLQRAIRDLQEMFMRELRDGKEPK